MMPKIAMARNSELLMPVAPIAAGPRTMPRSQGRSRQVSDSATPTKSGSSMAAGSRLSCGTEIVSTAMTWVASVAVLNR